MKKTLLLKTSAGLHKLDQANIRNMADVPSTMEQPESLKHSIPVEIWRDDKARQYDLPINHSDGAIGYDLRATENVEVPPRSFVDVPTGVRIGAPKDTWFMIFPRSSMFKKGIIMPTGIIDSDYRGYCFAPLFNISNAQWQVSAGDRICQVVFFSKLGNVQWIEVESADNLSTTKRGAGGFGSTGA
jgi:dUTP pyrophosphatase